MEKFRCQTSSDEETIAAGERLGSELEPGDAVALTGQLGAGKTHFSKGIARALGATDHVVSPTFGLVNEYTSGDLVLHHFDFYRMDDVNEVLRIGWEEYLDEDSVVVVEWADKFPELLPPHTRWIALTIGTDGVHHIEER